MYLSGIFQSVMPLFMAFMISIVFSLFSPLGIGFIIFGLIRLKTENEGLRKASLVFQIILSALTFLIGFLISLLFLFNLSSFYTYGAQSWMYMLAVIFGVSFTIMLHIALIIFGRRSS